LLGVVGGAAPRRQGSSAATRPAKKPHPVKDRGQRELGLLGVVGGPEPTRSVSSDVRATATAGPVATPAQTNESPVVGEAAPQASTTSQDVAASAAKSRKRVRMTGGLARPEGQRELGVLAVVGGTLARPQDRASDAGSVVEQAPTQIPAMIAEIDFSDLTWIRRVRHVRLHEPSVYALGMLRFAGVHYESAAKLTGMTPRAISSAWTRMRTPVDLSRRKFRKEFDLEVAQATMTANNLVVRRGRDDETYKSPPGYFWVERGDRTHYVEPMRSKRDQMIEGRYWTKPFVTREELDARHLAAAAPFAARAERMSA
jgi:hypothetical protein